MPSVEMRRSTRVFVPKAAKDGGLVKVLRSGRRLWGDPSSEINHQRSVKNALKNDQWFPLIDDDSNYKPPPRPRPPPFRPKQQHEERDISNVYSRKSLKPKPDLMDVDGKKPAQEREKTVKGSGEVCRSAVKVIRNVYSRKRKRNSEVSDNSRERSKFGLHFVRRKRRKNRGCEKEVLGDENGGLSIVVEPCAGCSIVSGLLGSVLKHLGNGRIGLTRLWAFLVSAPIANVFVSFGIQFLLNRQRMINRGVCRISGERQRVPLFTIDFTAIPLCFMGLHVTLSLRSVRLSCLCLMYFHAENESTCDEPLSCTDGQCDQMLSIPIAPNRDDRDMKIVVTGLEAGKVGSRIVQYRTGVLTRSSSKRRRRSLRNRKARNPSQFVMQKAYGPPVSNNVVFKKNGVQLPIFRDQELRRSARKNPSSEISVSKPSLSSVINVPKSSSSSLINVLNSSSSSVGLNVDIDLHQCCSVNVMVVETDKCYRIMGAEVALEISAANEWILAISKDGMTRYRLKAQNELRPHTINRFTQTVVWAAENGWKLEFPSRKDWVVFKELYKSCGERNIAPTSPAVKNIPIPGVSEVADFQGPTSVFEKPESYIRTMSDELSRILSRRTASYDMNSEDEEWLSEFNSELDEANHLSDNTFELMIDAFEKGSYCSLEDVHDERTAIGHCLDLASAEVIKPVYRYWAKKRKQKGVPLLRVFELNEPKRAQLIAKPVLRKKRSLKRASVTQPFSRGRGKDSNILQAMAVEHTILEEQHAVVRVQEARVSADKLVEVAIQKRERAQFLMENADLATYRATMALRIADAATLAVDSEQAASHFLD